VRKWQVRNAYKILVGKSEGKWPLGKRRRKWEYNIKMKREIECEVVNLMQQAKKTHRYRICNDLDFFREVSVSNFSRIPHYSDCGGGGSWFHEFSLRQCQQTAFKQTMTISIHRIINLPFIIIFRDYTTSAVETTSLCYLKISLPVTIWSRSERARLFS
jgi:hypothetical protein